jgi:hypothetical protein
MYGISMGVLLSRIRQLKLSEMDTSRLAVLAVEIKGKFVYKRIAVMYIKGIEQ